MIHQQADKSQAKGWFVGPWNTAVPIPVGYATEGIELLHWHEQMFEIYLVAQGQTTAVINSHPVILQAGDILVVEPGEQHTFRDSSPDYFHFVIQTPFVKGDKQLPPPV